MVFLVHLALNDETFVLCSIRYLRDRLKVKTAGEMVPKTYPRANRPTLITSAGNITDASRAHVADCVHNSSMCISQARDLSDVQPRALLIDPKSDLGWNRPHS